MTTYFVDFVNGNDANNGLGPDASHLTNKPWKTIAKALGAAGIASGDTAYLSPAGPFREVVTVAMTSPGAETFILGDPGNSQGFRTAGSVLVEPGDVTFTAWLTDDETAPSTTTLLNLAGRDNLTFRNIQFVGANNATCGGILATTTTSQNITIQDCAFLGVHNRQHIDMTTTFGVPLGWLIDRCFFGPTSATGIGINAATGTGSDFDVDVTIQNCVALGIGANTEFVNLNSTGAGAQRPGGGLILNCTILWGRAAITDATWATSIPAEVNNCIIFHLTNTGISGGASGNITEDWNVFFGTTAVDAEVTQGGNSVTNNSYAPLLNMFSQDRIWGAPEPRPWAEPLRNSPFLAFGNEGDQSALDMLTLPRPVSALCAVGAYGQRHNTFTRDPSPIGGGGAYALRIVGPGDYGFRIPVEDGVSYDISYDVQWDATYDDSVSKPQLRIDANPRIGVDEEVVTAVGSANTPETLTLSTITPTGRDFDFVVVRILSRDADGAGLVQSDDLVIA